MAYKLSREYHMKSHFFKAAIFIGAFGKKIVQTFYLIMRYAQLVIGPAGSGKSTYCSQLVQHCEALKRVVHVVNLDPAAETFAYPVALDVRDLVSVADVMEDEDLKFGPNGGLVFCMEYLLENLDWLEEGLGDFDNDYYIFDCPGQIELYTHIPVMKEIVDFLKQRDFRLCSVFLLDAQFLTDISKFFAGVMTTLAAMVQLEIPHISVLSKLDLVHKKDKKNLDRYLDPHTDDLLDELSQETNPKYKGLNIALAHLIDSYSLVTFLPLDITNASSIDDVLGAVDASLQYGEDQEVHVKDDSDIEETSDELK